MFISVLFTPGINVFSVIGLQVVRCKNSCDCGPVHLKLTVHCDPHSGVVWDTSEFVVSL